jgi:hypothetical protein
MAIYDLPSRWQIPMQVTTYGSLSGLLGPVFLLSPVALLALRRREGRQLLLAAAVFGATYLGNIGTRFLIPPLPFVALAMALALSNVRGLALGVALLHAAISWPDVVPKYSRPEAWRLQKVTWREALRIKPEEPFLEANLTHYGVNPLIERVTPPGSTIFTFTPVPEAYTSRRIRVTYQSAENHVSGAIQWTPIVPEYAPTWRLRFGFPRQPLRAIRVVQNGSGTRDLWSIHELRVYEVGRELPRQPRWRLTANPWPWGIQSAFDNSILTFWMCGHWLRSGMYVEVDFGRPEQLDAVLIETAPNQWGIKLSLQGRDAAGRWLPLAGQPEMSDAPRPLGLRRAAAEELRRRGIDYLLVFDSDLGAEDLRTKAALWGIEEVGQYKQARLYKLP